MKKNYKILKNHLNHLQKEAQRNQPHKNNQSKNLQRRNLLKNPQENLQGSQLKSLLVKCLFKS
jgi:hypothetical protein